MSKLHPYCNHLQEQVTILLKLLRQEPSLKSQQDTTAIEASLKKALSPKFEIVALLNA